MKFADASFDDDTVQKILILNLCNFFKNLHLFFPFFEISWQELMSDSSYIDHLLSSFNAR